MLRTDYLDKTEPDLNKALQSFEDDIFRKFNSHKMGRIVAFNPELITVSVQILDKFLFRDKQADYTVLTDVPLMVYGNTVSRLTFGDVVGSLCLVHFNDTDLDKWFETGEAYEPNTARMHSLADGVAQLQPHSLQNKFSYDMMGTKLERNGSFIRLNNDGSIEVTNGTGHGIIKEGVFNWTGDMVINGALQVTGESVTIESANVAITGEVAVTGNLNQTGNQVVVGTVTAKDFIKVP